MPSGLHQLQIVLLARFVPTDPFRFTFRKQLIIGFLINRYLANRGPSKEGFFGWFCVKSATQLKFPLWDLRGNRARLLQVFALKSLDILTLRLASQHLLLKDFKCIRQPNKMAPVAMNGDTMAALEDIQAPPGVVLPPKEIKGASSHATFARNIS